MTIDEIINGWDPLDLLSHAPQNEYHSEIEAIEALASKTTDSAILAEGIYNIFQKSFGTISFQKPLSECVEISKRILSSMG